MFLKAVLTFLSDTNIFYRMHGEGDLVEKMPHSQGLLQEALRSKKRGAPLSDWWTDYCLRGDCVKVDQM